MLESIEFEEFCWRCAQTVENAEEGCPAAGLVWTAESTAMA